MENIMTNVFTRLNMLIAGGGAILAYLLGAHWYVFIAFLALNGIDWLTGTLRSKSNGTENSHKGGEGIKKKVGYWIAIVLTAIISGVLIALGEDVFSVDLSYMSLFAVFTTLTFIINELRSILENLVELGVPLKSLGFLTKGLEVAEKLLASKGDEDEPTSKEE